MLIKRNIKHVNFHFHTPSLRLLSSILKFALFKTMERWLNNVNIRCRKKIFNRAITLPEDDFTYSL